MSNTENKINVIIQGEKSGFNSITALHRFKQMVKSTNSLNETDYNKFLKPNFKLEMVNKTENDVTFKVSQNLEKNTSLSNETKEKTELERKKELLRAKIDMMRKMRTNNTTGFGSKSNVNVPSDIMAEYQKLVKMVGNKMPIPEPGDILSKPQEFRPLVSMVLGNKMMQSLGTNHPYVRYFRLLANKLGIETPLLPIPTQNFLTDQVINKLPSNMNNLIQMAGASSDLSNETLAKANPLGSNDDDTDSENSE